MEHAQKAGLPLLLVSKESACNAGDPDPFPGLGRSPGEENDNPLQCSCLENPMDRGAWQATVRGVTRVGHDLKSKPLPCLESGRGTDSLSKEAVIHLLVPLKYKKKKKT